MSVKLHNVSHGSPDIHVMYVSTRPNLLMDAKKSNGRQILSTFDWYSVNFNLMGFPRRSNIWKNCL